MKPNRILLATSIGVIFLTVAAIAATATIVNVRDFRRNEVYCKAIEVSGPTTIHIDAIGAGFEDYDNMAAYAWIIPSGAIDPVWVMEWDRTDEFGDDERLRRYDSNLELEPGKYEIYFYAGAPNHSGNFVINFDWDKLKQTLAKLKKEEGALEEDLKRLEEELGKNWTSDVVLKLDGDDEIIEEYRLEIEGDNDAIRITTCEYSSKLSVAEILRPDHDQYTSVGFSLAKPLQVEIQAVGEVANWDDTFADYGWILNADTRKRVWSMDESHLDWAGGAQKNQMVRRLLNLEAGNYLLYYVTDDSHTYDDWNSAPPYNPEAYGVRVCVTNERDRADVKPFKESLAQSPILSIVRVGDDFQEVRPFRVSEDTEVRVYAIGEYETGSGEFADYAWIEREGDSQPFWLMMEDNTEPAGGAKKNRLADQIVKLPKGDYVLGYVTDGSHAYGDWNTTPPYDQSNYGVTLFAVDKTKSRTAIVELNEESDAADVLAKLTRVGDDAEESASFSLDKPTRVRILALGEGSHNEMYDYGWIENVDDDDVVWEMTYRKTKPAGGADKNRMVDTEILLDKGRYRVHFVTDGSHAFGDWNDDKPRSPQSWGITVYRAE